MSQAYLPESFIICNPRNLKKHEIQSFFQHLKVQQDVHGAKDAFQFSKYKGNDCECHDAGYPKTAGLQQEPARASPRKHNAKKGKEKVSAHAMALDTMAPKMLALYAPAPNLSAPETSAQNTVAPDTAAQSKMSTGFMLAVAEAPMVINQASMMALVAQGYLPVPLLNGPNKGEPQYMVPALALRMLNLLAPSHADAVPGSDITVDPPPVAPRHRHGRTGQR